MPNAYFIKITGVVQGVGFRPFIYRLARTNGLTGWVLNAEQGVQIHLEGEEQPLQSFLLEIRTISPRAANVAGLTVESAAARESEGPCKIEQTAELETTPLLQR